MEYPLFRNLATALVISSVILLSGCFSSGGSKSESLQLDSATPSGCAPSSTDNDAYVYKCNTGSGEIFLTAVKECGSDKESTASSAATTRQLLIGLTNIRVLEQKPLSDPPSQSLYSLIEGKIDETPISIATFSFKTPNCIQDYVAWAAKDSIDDSAFKSDARALLEIFSKAESLS